MKKLIFGLAFAFSASVATAGTSIDWGVGIDGIGDGDSASTSASVAYLINTADFTQINIYNGVIGGKTLEAVLGSSYVATTPLTEGSFSTLNVAVDKYSAGSVQNLFMVCYDANLGESGALYFSEQMAQTIAATGATPTRFDCDSSWGLGIAQDMKSFNASAGGWVDAKTIPEPTSGLLLLLGFAGLALRRKRA